MLSVSKPYMSILVVVFSILVVKLNAQSGQLDFLVKPYIQNTTSTSVMVIWETTTNSVGEVNFGKAVLNKNEPNLDYNVESTSFKQLHTVELKNLEPASIYFYRVLAFNNDGDTLICKVSPIKTFPVVNEPFSFTVFSDSQQQDDPYVWTKISHMALLERPNFGLIVGDLVDDGHKVEMWREQFLPAAHDYMKSIPLFPVMGNHDDNSAFFYKYMKSRNGESFYTFTYGNTQFFIIDSNQDVEEQSKQYNWLEEELAKSKSTWKVAALHHPAYSSDYDDFGNTDVALKLKGDPAMLPLVPLFERYNVDLVFDGHVHCYERTWPILEDKAADNGVIYIQTGGAGGNLEKSAVIRSWFTAKIKSVHNYCLVSVNGDELVFNAIDYNGNNFDYFKLSKDNAEMNPLSSPIIRVKNNIFMDKLEINIEDYNKDAEIRYTLDGSNPSPESKTYNGEIVIDESTLLKVCSYKDNQCSKINSKQLTKVGGLKGISLENVKNGLLYSYYEGDGWLNLPDFKIIKKTDSGICNNFVIEPIKAKEDQFAILYGGYIKVDDPDVYSFYVRSDDGTKLFIDDKLIIDNDGSHSSKAQTGQVALRKGYHKIALQYYDDCEGEELIVMFKISGTVYRKFFDDELFH